MAGWILTIPFLGIVNNALTLFEGSMVAHSVCLFLVCIQSITEDKSLQASSSGDGDSSSKTASIQEEDEEGDEEEDEEEDDIKDLLINHDDIKPLDCNQTNEEGGGDGDEDDIESKTKNLTGPQKTKKLVEEVSKRMSDEQKVEERRFVR